MTATIIAFRRTSADPAAPGPDAPQVRLAAALAGLDAALAQQRAAIAEWRQSLQDLRGSVRGLGQSLSAYQSTLGQAADDVTAVNRQARQLESWADGVLATAR